MVGWTVLSFRSRARDAGYFFRVRGFLRMGEVRVIDTMEKRFRIVLHSLLGR